jgi:uncharacterized protein YdaU (DUF1376 family)
MAVKVNSYPKHIGDWRSGTAHMSLAEEGAYTRLVDQYYLDQGHGWTLEHCLRICRAITREEQKAVRAVLEDKFEKRADGYGHAGMDARIEGIAAASEKYQKRARIAAQARHNRAKSDATSNASSTDKDQLGDCQPVASSQKEEEGAHSPSSSVGDRKPKKPKVEAAAWRGDMALRQVVADDQRFGEAWCKSYLDPCEIDGLRLDAKLRDRAAKLRQCPHLQAFEIVPPP